jgi:predicted nucleic acid-binding protein
VNDVVIDASTMVRALTETSPEADGLRYGLMTSTCHAPYLLDAEVGHVLRRLERTGAISDEEARTALAALPHLINHRYPHTGRLAGLAWELRHVVTYYDGLYVALAATLDIPLRTADEKLGKAPGLPCRFELA